jgi:hypothetical protein
MGPSWSSPQTATSWRIEGASAASPRPITPAGSGGRGQVKAGSHGIRCERPSPYRAHRSDRPAQAPGVRSLWRRLFHVARGAPMCGKSRGIFNNRSPGGRPHAADGSAGRIPQVTPHQLPGVGALRIDVHRDCILRASVRRHRSRFVRGRFDRSDRRAPPERLCSVTGPAPRSVLPRKTVMPARSSASPC